ncbi:FAD/NAD(P)-binding domain-containing protein [Colletotrichum sublineola]|nr:FAD/NAD(P)-binding domain-containing protein [Colletotrichum sublineola]
MGNVEHVIYDKNEDLEGVWFENRYPGCACDVPSHAYTLPFALNPDWPRFYSSGFEIWAYVKKVCDVFDLTKHMRFKHRVIGCYWQQDTGNWLVKTRRALPDGSTYAFEDHYTVLLYGPGLINNFRLPDIEGLDTFGGKVMHTAAWPGDYSAAYPWEPDRVAVIGSGASSVQVVPAMQPYVRKMHVFVRTEAFRKNPAALVAHAKEIEDGLCGFFPLMFKGSTAQAHARKEIAERMTGIIKDERLLRGFTPAWSVGCKRPNPGDPYMRVQCVGALYARRQGHPHIPTVIGADGTQCEVDAIICAMGFDVSFRPRFPIVGKDGVDLTAKWEDCPEGYMGIAVPDFPNLFTFQGPNSPVQNGSSLAPCSMPPSHHHPKTGRLNAIWPGSSLHYMDTIGLPRYEDYDIMYLGLGKKNRFAYLGMGTARVTVEKGDQSPYLAIDKMDSRWLKASGIDVEKVLEHRAEAARRKWRQEMQDNGQDVKVEIEGKDVRV